MKIIDTVYAIIPPPPPPPPPPVRLSRVTFEIGVEELGVLAEMTAKVNGGGPIREITDELCDKFSELLEQAGMSRTGRFTHELSTIER